MMRNKDDYRSMNGLQKAALLIMSVGEETAAKLFTLMHDDEIREISQTMANLGTVNATVIERLFVEFADQISSTGTHDRHLRIDRTPAVQGARQEQGRHHHGRDPRPRRPHHVGQARQRARGGARQLPEERISADRRGGAVQGEARARGARAVDAARSLRHGSHHAHAAHGIGAEGHPGRRRARAAQRVHEQPGAHRSPRRARDDRRNLQ